ncbi:MAG: transcriptional repressor [Ottowia sp.]|uniref:Fur family transcriptional regulator n=1 Tax=unclassified Ottowia TaxID=2645081 RepID=UPI003C2CC591
MERSTRQRHSIRSVLEAAGRPLLPSEILAEAQRDVPALGLATVYRNIKQLIDAGEIQAVELPGEHPRYELAGHQHHHHFQCRTCDRVFDVHACPGDMRKLAPHGFIVEDHELTLYGVCVDCQSRSRQQAPSPSPKAPQS